MEGNQTEVISGSTSRKQNGSWLKNNACWETDFISGTYGTY